MEETPILDPFRAAAPPPPCSLCGKAAASTRLPFSVGRQETPPLPVEHRILGIGPRRKRFVQRYRWAWYSLRLCLPCHRNRSKDQIWGAIQNHPETRRLVAQGYTETRLEPDFKGPDGDITFTEEAVV